MGSSWENLTIQLGLKGLMFSLDIVLMFHCLQASFLIKQVRLETILTPCSETFFKTQRPM